MSASSCVNIFVIGVGGVGRHFLSQLSNLIQKNDKILLYAIIRSTKCLIAEEDASISLTNWEEELEASTHRPLTINSIIGYASSKQSQQTILVDNTSSQEIADAYPQLLEKGINIVTPNKKAFSGSFDLWHAIQESTLDPMSMSGLKRGLMYHESSVGAGLPIISTLKDLIDTGDEVQRIEGVFSGTMSFLFNSFAPVEGQGGKWSDEVKKAKLAGFTEPDPRDDLNGVDVARKLVILARIMGMKVQSTDSFPVQSLIPKKLEHVESGDVFLEKLGEFDRRMEEIREKAKKQGMVVRFVGSIDTEKEVLKVGLENFDKGHPIAGLKGSDNIVSFYTKRYGSSPLVVQGAGAGGAVTAMGVTADLIKAIQRISWSLHPTQE